MTEPSLIQNVRKLTIWVPVGGCPSLTFSLLAKVFAKGKMFRYTLEIINTRQVSIANLVVFIHVVISIQNGKKI